MLAALLRPPSEVHLLGVYAPPFLFVCLLGFLIAFGAARLLNWAGWSGLFWRPPLAFLAIWVLASSLLGLALLAP